MTLEKLVEHSSLGQNLKSREVFISLDSGISLTLNPQFQNLLVSTSSFIPLQ